MTTLEQVDRFLLIQTMTEIDKNKAAVERYKQAMIRLPEHKRELLRKMMAQKLEEIGRLQDKVKAIMTMLD